MGNNTWQPGRGAVTLMERRPANISMDRGQNKDVALGRHDKMMLVKMTWRMVNTYINIYLYIYNDDDLVNDLVYVF